VGPLWRPHTSARWRGKKEEGGGDQAAAWGPTRDHAWRYREQHYPEFLVRRGTIRAAQTSLQSMEVRAVAQQNASTMRTRFMNRRIGQALEERLPGFVERLHRHREAMARVVQAGTAMVERLAAIVRHRATKRRAEAEYWRKTQRDGSTYDQAETQKHAKKRGMSR
jgi:hypothetical protein